MLNRSYRKKLRYRISNKKSKPINTYMNRVKTDKRIQIDHTQNKFNFTKQSRFEKFWGLPDGSLKPIFFICIFILSMHLLRKIANDDSLLSVINDALFLNEEANKVIIINTCIGVLTSFLVIKSIEKTTLKKYSVGLFIFFTTLFPLFLDVFALIKSDDLSQLLTFFSMLFICLFSMIKFFVSK